jgi:hypothetical protein
MPCPSPKGSGQYPPPKPIDLANISSKKFIPWKGICCTATALLQWPALLACLHGQTGPLADWHPKFGDLGGEQSKKSNASNRKMPILSFQKQKSQLTKKICPKQKLDNIPSSSTSKI